MFQWRVFDRTVPLWPPAMTELHLGTAPCFGLAQLRHGQRVTRMWLSRSALLEFFQKVVQIVKLTRGSSESQWIQCSVVSRLKLLAKPEPWVRACLLLPGGLHFNFVKITFVCNYLSIFFDPGLLRLKRQVSKELKTMCRLCCILPNFLGSTACPYMPRSAKALTIKARVRSCYHKVLSSQQLTHTTASSIDTKHEHRAQTSATHWVAVAACGTSPR